MNAKFIVNDYVLIWNLLFQASISEEIYNLKQKLWDTYRKEYNSTYIDKESIIKDLKNFIPNNDTIYNIILGKDEYALIKKSAEKHRLEVMEVWDKHKKVTANLYKNIFRKEVPDYHILVVSKELNVIEHVLTNSVVLGKGLDEKNPLKILLQINLIIFMNNIKKYKEEEVPFKKAIVELAVLNEYATNLSNKSCYLSGSPELLNLKRWLYPYWLMYLGVPKDEFDDYMKRDKIEFNKEKYAYEKELKNMNIEEFIDFCIRNQKYIIRENHHKVEEEII